jgi:hypothetical protein
MFVRLRRHILPSMVSSSLECNFGFLVATNPPPQILARIQHLFPPLTLMTYLLERLANSHRLVKGSSPRSIPSTLGLPLLPPQARTITTKPLYYRRQMLQAIDPNPLRAFMIRLQRHQTRLFGPRFLMNRSPRTSQSLMCLASRVPRYLQSILNTMSHIWTVLSIHLQNTSWLVPFPFHVPIMFSLLQHPPSHSIQLITSFPMLKEHSLTARLRTIMILTLPVNS